MPAELLPPGPPDALQVTLLALVQGLTEFLPVSSSGHLVLLQEVLGVSEGGLLLPVALHVGTLLAVVGVYRHTLVGTLRDLGVEDPRRLVNPYAFETMASGRSGKVSWARSRNSSRSFFRTWASMKSRNGPEAR